MLDFAIFAVTFLLALVGAVLYLYPVTPDSGFWGAPAPRGPGRERLRESHVVLPRSLCACVLSLLGRGPGRVPHSACPGQVLGGDTQLPGVTLETLTPSIPRPVCFYIRGETPSIFS